MADKPVNHGADHRSGGTDPIPDKPWAYFATSGSPAPSLATGTTTFVDVDLIDTNSPEVIISHTYTGFAGIDILGRGVYLYSLTCYFTCASAPAAGAYSEAFMLSWDGQLVGDPILAPWFATPGTLFNYTSTVIQMGVINVEVGGPTPNKPSHAEVFQNSGNTVDVNLQLFIWQVAGIGSSILG